MFGVFAVPLDKGCQELANVDQYVPLFALFFFFISSGGIGDLLDGSLVSNCILPCVTTQTHTEFLSDEKTDEEMYLDITFSSKVRVIKTDLVKPTISSFLSEVG